MAVLFRNRTSFYITRRYSKVTWVLFAVLLFFLWDKIPEPSKTKNNAFMDRPTPEYNIAEKPQFLYHSKFRKNPNYAYEASIDNSLRRIEEKILAENGGNLDAPETIWQIMLGANKESNDRGPDSLAFEQQNQEWEYKGRFPA